MIKRLIFWAVSGAVLFGAAYNMPLFLLIAFNYGKGIQNNEDGILFIPFGFLLAAIAVFLGVMLVRNAWKKNRDDFRGKWAVIGVVAGILVLAVVMSHSTWEAFWTCFAHFKGLNLGLQR